MTHLSKSLYTESSRDCLTLFSDVHLYVTLNKVHLINNPNITILILLISDKNAGVISKEKVKKCHF